MKKGPKTDDVPEGATEDLRATRSVPTVEGCVLYVSDGPEQDRGSKVELARGRAQIGTDPGCDLVLSDGAVSRRHVELSVLPEGVSVRDLDSKNGTRYMGQQITTALLSLGARIEVGRCLIDLLPIGGVTRKLSSRESYGQLLGNGVAMRRLYTLLERLEGSDAPILILGETGVGKELVARAVHEHGLRAGKTFAVIDCGNMQAELMRSEIFGHVKGAFTGANADSVGAFEAADGGTLFLDEVGELPEELQPRLLRALESGMIQRIGETTHRKVDVRVIAATNRDLAKEVDEGRFRSDLYYRLAVVSLSVPALRERPEDVPLLASHLVKLLSKGKRQSLPAAVLGRMASYDWPGNVRELRNAVHRLLSLGSVEIAGVEMDDDLPAPTATRSVEDFKRAREGAIREFEGAYLRELLDNAGGTIRVAAKQAGIDRKYLRDLLRKHGLYQKDDDR